MKYAIRVFKEEKIQKELLASYVDYDSATIDYLIRELEAGIRRAKLTQFKSRLSQKRTIPAMSMASVEDELSGEHQRVLKDMVDKIGKLNSLKLITLLKDGMTPDEQQKVLDLLMDQLSEEEVVRLNDVLGKFVE